MRRNSQIPKRVTSDRVTFYSNCKYIFLKIFGNSTLLRFGAYHNEKTICNLTFPSQFFAVYLQ